MGFLKLENFLDITVARRRCRVRVLAVHGRELTTMNLLNNMLGKVAFASRSLVGGARLVRNGRPIAGLIGKFTASMVIVGASSVSFAQESKVSCQTCHTKQGGELGTSVHHSLACQECHSGEDAFMMAKNDLAKFLSRSADSQLIFDHGKSFLGKPSRKEVPERCGTCHADVARMNPYGLHTDQLARYWTSGHGKALRDEGNEKVAVCIDCHGSHNIKTGHDPESKTYPLNVPDTCSSCHADKDLMAEAGLPVEVVSEYRDSVHGKLLYEQGDTGAPTCATCHGNHSAIPPGFSTIGAVCGQCHQHESSMFATSIHATLDGHKGCVQCHGGGADRHFHHIERITKPPGILIERYAHLLESKPDPTAAQVAEAINPSPKQIINHALATCMDCHEELEDDESLPKLFKLLDDIAAAELQYVETANRLEHVGQGVLLVENQRFLFEAAKTHLIALAPTQHTLNNEKVAEKVAAMNDVCAQVNGQLDELEAGLTMRYKLLAPIWIFAVLFSIAIYAKYKQLKGQWVKPLK